MGFVLGSAITVSEPAVKVLGDQIEENLKNKKQTIQKAFDIDYKKWEVKLDIEILSKIIDNIKYKKIK